MLQYDDLPETTKEIVSQARKELVRYFGVGVLNKPERIIDALLTLLSDMSLKRINDILNKFKSD